MDKEPLVSVIILSYNSSAFIIETLDSIYRQTYEKVELIISDDCSTDSTRVLVEKWLDVHRERFVNSIFVTTGVNRGVSANINNGLQYARGCWLKILAADDVLVNEAISDYVSFCEKESCDICASDFKCIDEKSIEYTPKLDSTYYRYLVNLDSTLDNQRKCLYSGLLYPGPTAFQSKKSLEAIGGAKEEYISEEWPLQYFANKVGYRVFPLKKQLVLYRVHEKSFCRANKNPRYRLLLRDQFLFYKREVFKDAIRGAGFLKAWHNLLRYYSYYRSFDNRIFKLVMLLSPIEYLELFKRKSSNAVS